ncbi:peptidoglycan-binding protein [Streptomyces lavendulae]|uniref:peptidoglycan-binding protein n=1 Tax=Streptomyces lavendulae TaxID=1914 RepID=UPI0036B34E10
MSTVERVLSVAKAEEGYREGYSGGHYNNKNKFSPAVPGLEWSDWQAWCATFVSWVAMTADAADLYPRTASCWDAVQWFKAKGRFSEYPAIGAQVFFGSGGGTHTGLVYAYDADYIYTVEGNTNDTGSAEGNGVYLKTRERRSSYTYGYGYPEFPEGITSADPTWQAQKPADPAPVEYAPFPGASWFKRNPNSPLVTAMGKRLVAEGCSAYTSGPGPQWTKADKDSYAKWQRKRGFSGSDADGWPGRTTWDALRVPKV